MVIAARNAAATIGEQLEALAAQGAHDRWEVVVVDNGSVDDTVEVALGFRDRLLLRVVAATDGASAAYARNVGARAAAGSLLLFVDADDRVAPGWLAAMSAAAQHADALGGNVALFSRDASGGEQILEPPHADLPVHGFAFLPAVCGGNCGIRKELLWDLGGWNEGYRGASGEDFELFWRAHLAGHPAAFVGDAVLMCRVRTSLGAVLEQSYRYGASHPRLYRDFRDAGMPPSPRGEAVRTWLRLLIRGPLMLRSAAGRRSWVTQVGHRAGRLAGSMRAGVVYL